MSNAVAMLDVASLVRDGKITEAASAMAEILDNAPVHDLEVIAQCAEILETYPKIGAAKLRDLWRRSDDHDRAIIEACAPALDEERPRLDDLTPEAPAPDYGTRRRPGAPASDGIRLRADGLWLQAHRTLPTYETEYTQAASPVRILRLSPAEHQRRREASLQRAHDRTVHVKYFTYRLGVDDEAPANVDERPPGYELDYDNAAQPSVRGTACLHCFAERSSRDLHATHDDGLCEFCRDRRDVTGIPDPFKRGAIYADFIGDRCTYIQTHYPRATVNLLRQDWTRSPLKHRPAIQDFAKRASATSPQPAAPLVAA